MLILILIATYAISSVSAQTFLCLMKLIIFWWDEQSKYVCFTGCTFIGSSCLLEFAKTTAETNGPETKHYVQLSLPFLPPEGMVLK